MCAMKNDQFSEDNTFTINKPADLIREQFAVSASLFDELKCVAVFIFNTSDRLGFSNEKQKLLKEKIEAMLLSLNELALEAFNQAVNDAQKQKQDVNDAANSTQMISYDDMQKKYDEALNQICELTKQMNEVSIDFDTLQNKLKAQQSTNIDLEHQVEQLRREKEELKHQVCVGKAKSLDDVDPDELIENLQLKSSMPIVKEEIDVSGETTKTIDDYIETFENVFKNADQVVQLIKSLGRVEETMKNAYTNMALAKSRFLRQVLIKMLEILRKARADSNSDNKMGLRVAEELKRIYKTLKSVNLNEEKPSDAKK